jgi:hypothetical protein
MASVAGQGTTFNLPNFTGELYNKTPTATTFLSMAGGVTGGEMNSTKEDVWETTDNAAAGQTGALEGADPDYTNRNRAEVSNVKQIYQYGFAVSYTKQAATGNLGTPAAAPANSVTGSNPVTDEISFQRNLKLDRMARDVNYSMLNGVYAKPTDNDSPRKSRGIVTACVTNTVDAGADALTKADIDALLKEMADSGSPFTTPVIFCNSFNKQQISNIYGYAPESRNVGGVNISMIETDFTTLGIVYERQMPTDTVLIADMSYITPTHLTIPGKGLVFVEPKPSTGSSWNFQLYGEIGMTYGSEQFHGTITNTATA